MSSWVQGRYFPIGAEAIRIARFDQRRGTEVERSWGSNVCASMYICSMFFVMYVYIYTCISCIHILIFCIYIYIHVYVYVYLQYVCVYIYSMYMYPQYVLTNYVYLHCLSVRIQTYP